MSAQVHYINTSFMSDTVTREERLAAIGRQRSRRDQIEFVGSWLFVSMVVVGVLAIWVKS